MKNSVIRYSPQGWIEHMFSAKAARTGGVIRRNVAWVEREVGRELFEAEVRKRGFHLIETGRQLVVICNHGELRLLF